MAQKDKERWNKKYESIDNPDLTPSDILKNFYHLAKVGNALDIACGLGRNALFLAERGFKVDAVDISEKAIQFLKGKNKNINGIVADLDSYKLKENYYDIVVNVNFLDRRLLPQIRNSLKKDGVLIFETFLAKGKRENKDFYLQENELIRYFIDFYIVFYSEKQLNSDEYKAYLVAIKKC